MLNLVIGQIPNLARTAFWHTLSLSPTSPKLDLRTELVVTFIRSLLTSPSSRGVHAQQIISKRAPDIQGKLWISKIAMPVPAEDDIRQILCQAVDDLKDSPSETYATPHIFPVEAEWTGYRSNVDSRRPRPDLSEQQHFERLMSDTTTPTTILYFHGGAFFLMDPATHRAPVSYLARLTGGRALSVRYRLAPQNPFPAALLDALTAYIYLLYPPTGAYHEPVLPSHVVLAGDSAGGNICLALTQLLLQINRSMRHPTSRSSFRFHGRDIPLPIPLPAGLATHSPWLDLTRCMPSKITNQKYDYLPSTTREHSTTFPSDDIWPTQSPRGDLYCETSMLCHPLVSPLAAKDWTGAPPMWMAYGEEMLVDEGRQIAALASRQGVQVMWEEWEAMSHCFGMILLGSAMSKRFFRDWAGFIRAVSGVGKDDERAGKARETQGGWEWMVGEKGAVETKGVFFEAKTQRERSVEVTELAVLSREEVERRMREKREERAFNPQQAEKTVPKL